MMTEKSSYTSHTFTFTESDSVTAGISTGLIKSGITVEQTAHFSLLSGKKLSKITARPFHREIGRHYL